MTQDYVNLTEYILARVYSKANTYNQTEINNNIANAIKSVDIVDIVNELPTSDIQENKLYLLPNTVQKKKNKFDIYLYVDGEWEMIDSMDLNVNNLYTMAEVDDLLSNKADKDHTHSIATSTADGFLSSSDKSKLDNVESGANKTIIDSELSSTSNNPVANNVINSVLIGKASKNHTSNSTEYGVSNNSNYGHSKAGNVEPLMDGISNIGTDNGCYARADHVHPTDTSRASTNIATTNSNGLLSANDKSKLDGISPGATVNTVDSSMSSTSFNSVQNKVVKKYVDDAIENVISGGVDLTGYLKTSGGSLTGNLSSNSNITTSATIQASTIKLSGTSTGFLKANGTVDTNSYLTTVTAHTNSNASSIGQATDSLFGHCKVINNLLTSSHTNGVALSAYQGYVLKDLIDDKANTTHSHDNATSSKNGFMSSTDKSKLDGIDTGANKITVDTSLSSSSTNPLTNKAINTALNGKSDTNHTHSNASTSSDGFMSSTDKTKLNGIDTGANKITVDTSLSSTSTNPLTNKAINTALDGKAPKSHASSNTDYGVSSKDNYGHSKATTTTPSDISKTSASVGTDNGLYARGDHTHKHPSYTSYSSGLYKVTIDSTGHVSSATSVTLTYTNGTFTIN